MPKICCLWQSSAFVLCTRCTFCSSLGKRRAVKECAELQWISYPCFQMAAVSLLDLFSFSLRRKLFLSFSWWRKFETVEVWDVEKGRNRDGSRMKMDDVQSKKFNAVSSESHAHARTDARTHTRARAIYVLRMPVHEETAVGASLHGRTSGGKPTCLVSQKSSLQEISGCWFLCCRLQTGRRKFHRVLSCRCQPTLRAWGSLQSVGVPSRLTGNSQRRLVTLRLSCRCCSRPYSCTDNKKTEKNI